MSGRAWGWLGLLAMALFVLGALGGSAVAAAWGAPTSLGGLAGAAVGFLAAGLVLRRAAAAAAAQNR